MNASVRGAIKSLWHAELFTPKDFVRRAVVLAVIFAVADLAGLRQYTSILNGTAGSLEISRGLAAFLGLSYVFAYLGFVLLVPILLLAAGLLAVCGKMAPTRNNDRGPNA